MKNNILRNIFIIILIVILLTAFSSSYTSRGIDNLAYVIAIGIDISNNDNIKVTFQFMNSSSFSKDSSSDQESSFINTVESSSIDTAINLMNTYLSKELNLSHCKVVVFSEDIAKDGISTIVYNLINNSQLRPTTNVVVSKCDASYYIENSKPILESILTKYYDVFPNSSRYTGFTDNITIGEFFNNMVSDTREATAILGGMNFNNYNSLDNNTSDSSSIVMSNYTPIVGERATENIGLAVFKDAKLVGELTALETLCHMILSNQVDSFIISVPDTQNANQTIDLSSELSKKSKFKVNIVDGAPYVTVDVYIESKILSIEKETDYLSTSVLKSISNSTNSYLESTISGYLYKTSKEFKSDIDCIGCYASKNFLTNKELEAFDWKNSYQNAFFNVNVHSNTTSSVLLDET